ncbi:MAG TPA: hypothetical protein DEG43_17420, partial [Acidimicrobiaceae bacterium]|nr:hypothetical protein [Acidimicrobiaceae bacterium]
IIEVKSGTYTENFSVPADKHLMFYSSAGAKTTILQSGASPILTVAGDAVIDGFTISPSSGSSLTCVQFSGAGVSTLSNCSIYGRSVGVSVTNTPTVLLRHCTVQASSNAMLASSSGMSIRALNCAFKGSLNVTGSVLTLDTVMHSQSSVPGTLLGTIYREQVGYSGNDPTIFASAGINADGSLAANSPLINKGRVIANAGPLFDFDGLPRANSGSDLPDIGVDESSDSDDDALPDWWEQQYFGNLSQTGHDDSDGDGLTNIQEVALGTNPILADTDGDGLRDNAEIAEGRNPRVVDLVGALSITPTPDLYSSAQWVTITCAPESDASIRYTIDGTEPTTSSPLYSGPLSVTTSSRIKARGFKLNFTPTEVVVAGYGIHPDAALLPSGGVKLWLRGDEGLTLDASGNVQQWKDLSGALHHLSQSSSNKRPAAVVSSLANKTSVRFDGLDDVLTNTNAAGFPTRYVTAFVVSKTSSLAASAGRKGLLSWWTTSNANEFGICVDPAESLGLVPFRRANPLSTSTQSGFPPFAPRPRGTDQFDALVVSLNTDTQQFKLYEQGSLATSGNGFSGYNSVRIPANGTLAIGSLLQRVSSVASPTAFMPGEVAEVIVYDRLLSDPEITQLYAWFGTHFGDTLLRPIATPASGTYPNSVSVTLASASPNAEIRYTTDGSTPNEDSPLFASDSPIAFNTEGPAILKARAYRSGANVSGTSTFNYNIDTLPPVISNLRFNDVAFGVGSAVTTGGTFRVDASDVSGISSVEFRIDDQIVATDSTTTDGYTFIWRPSGSTNDGPHTLVIRALDAFQTSSELTVPFSLALAPPAAPIITSPSSDQTLNTASVNIIGTAVSGALVNVYHNGAMIAAGIGLDGAGTFKLNLTLAEGVNFLSARAFFRSGELSPESIVRTLNFDNTEPAPPVGLVIQRRSGGTLRLDWVPPSSGADIVAYNVYRSAGDFASKLEFGVTKLNTAPINLRQYSDTPANGVTGPLFYRVTSIDSAGNESDFSTTVSAAPDRTGPSVIATYVAVATSTDPPVKFGPGPLTLTLVFSEPLSGTPFVAMKSNGHDAQPLALQYTANPAGGTGPAFTAEWDILPSTPSGIASLIVTASDNAGNTSSGVTQGATVMIDTLGPTVMELDLPSGVRNNAATPAEVTLRAVLDEACFDAAGQPAAPVFSYTLSRSSPTTALPITVSAGADALHWTLNFTLPESAGSVAEVLRLAVSARDQLGNANPAFFMDPVIEVFQNDPQAPAIPANLNATATPGGHIRLTWQNAEPPTGYRLYRGTAADGSDLTILPASSTLTGTTLNFDDLPAANSYWGWQMTWDIRSNTTPVGGTVDTAPTNGSKIAWEVPELAEGASYVVSFEARASLPSWAAGIRFQSSPFDGSKFQNQARITSYDVDDFDTAHVRSVSGNRLASSYLKISTPRINLAKQVNPSVGPDVATQIDGDHCYGWERLQSGTNFACFRQKDNRQFLASDQALDYHVNIGLADASELRTVNVADRIPLGWSYVPGSARLDHSTWNAAGDLVTTSTPLFEPTLTPSSWSTCYYWNVNGSG